jgi:hypothetical protein
MAARQLGAILRHLHRTIPAGATDGRRLMTLEWAYDRNVLAQVSIWETDPFKLVTSQTSPAATVLTSRPAFPPEPGWAPLGRQAAVLTADGIVVVDGSTGQFDLRVPGEWKAPLAASPDHKLLAAPRGGRQALGGPRVGGGDRERGGDPGHREGRFPGPGPG